MLADAQVVGDLQALTAAKRRAVRVHLGSNVAANIAEMAAQLG